MGIPVDRILYNGLIITLNDAQPHVSALAIHSGRIVALGGDLDMLALAGPTTACENLGGQTVIPGMTDAHIHWEGTARALHLVNVFEVAEKSIAVERVAERAARTPTGQWITGHGWFQDIWPDKAFPTAADLDPVSPAHPVFLRAKSGHAGWANSLALKLSGITRDTPDPDGGQLVRDAQGSPTGVLLEDAMLLIANNIPAPTPEQLADEMLAAQQFALASGLTGIHDFDDPSCLRALQILRERDQLALRVVKNINKRWLDAALDSGLRGGFGDDWIRIGALKIFADGALGPRTAAMIAPYEGEPDNYGIVTAEKEEMIEWVTRATLAGLPSTIHAIGDRAVHDVLDVYEIARSKERAAGITPSQRRHRIEHVQLIHPDDKHRLAQLQVIASMQPLHATSDMLASDRYWGKRSQWAYNARLQIDQGALVAFGSDSPIEPFEPLKGIHAAVTRRRPDGSPGPDGWYTNLRLTVDEALRGFTRGPAYTASMEDRLGRLAAGYYADLVVLGQNPYSIDPDELLHIPVAATMVNGIWRHGGL
jgi:hypothetical protein